MKNKVIKIARLIGLGFLEPVIRLISGEQTKKNAKESFKVVLLPVLSVFLFLLVWQSFSSYLFSIERSTKIEMARKDQGEAAAQAVASCIDSGEISCQPNYLPSPSQVWHAAQTLWDDHKKLSQKRKDFQIKIKTLNEQRIASGQDPIRYTGRPSFVDQIGTSLKTVFAGFLLSVFIAVPAGIFLGLSETLRKTVNWIIQIFKPVSPVVWLLLVSMVLNSLIKDPNLDKSFIISFISVGLCSMWATLVNTSVGVSSVDKDFINVARVLQLGVLKKTFKIVLPSSFPLIFTGLRITLSVAWMVLIAIELLAQSPGLGSFVWEEFQNGANDSNAKILVAMFVIGFIGFLLERMMFSVQNLLTFTQPNS
jgi:nitrate/nitrite transport system permease protein